MNNGIKDKVDSMEEQISDLQSRVSALENTDNLKGVRVVPVPGNIDSTGQTDVSDELQRFFFDLPDNVIVRFKQNGLYWAEGGILLSNKQNVEVQGNGAVIECRSTLDQSTLVREGNRNLITDSDNSFYYYNVGNSWAQWPRNRQIIRINNCSDITIDNLDVSGPNIVGGYKSAYEAQHGYQVRRSSNVTITNCDVSDVWGDFVYIAYSDNIRINNNKFTNAGRQGIGISDGQDIYITENSLDKIGRSAIDLEPYREDQVVKNVFVENNTFGRTRFVWLANRGKAAATISNIHMLNNISTGTAPKIISVGSPDNKRGPFYITGNEFHGGAGNPQKAAWKFVNANGLYIEGNSTPLQFTVPMFLVGAVNCDNINLGENEVWAISHENGKRYEGPAGKRQFGSGGCWDGDWYSANNVYDYRDAKMLTNNIIVEDYPYCS